MNLEDRLNEITNQDLTPLEGGRTSDGEVIKRTATLEISNQDSNLRNAAEDSDVIIDYLHTRDVLYTLINETTSALAGAIELANESEHPRAYSVVRELVDSTRALTTDLMGLQKTYKEISKLSGGVDDAPDDVDTGGRGKPMTTADLQKFISSHTGIGED